MKRFFGAALVVGWIVVGFANAPVASARYGLEDPQLCINGVLLKVVPAVPSDVTVVVPQEATVNSDVRACGGDPALGVITQYSFDKGPKIRVTAAAPDGTPVLFTYNGDSKLRVSDDGSAQAKFKLP